MERLNGILKMQFMSLRGLRIAVTKRADVQRACDFCSACMILHNFCNRNRDSWVAPTDPVDIAVCDQWCSQQAKIFAHQERRMVATAIQVNASLREAQLAFRDVVAADCVLALANSFMV